MYESAYTFVVAEPTFFSDMTVLRSLIRLPVEKTKGTGHLRVHGYFIYSRPNFQGVDLFTNLHLQ